MTHIARRDTLHAISGWLNELANLTAGSAPLADAKAKVASIATSLADVFPVEAFSRQSLVAVARECKFFPSYAEICNRLGEWWRENRPAPLLIGDARGLDADGQRWLAYFHKREAEGFRNADGSMSSRARVLSLLKQQSPAAWARITGEDIAPKAPPTHEEIAAIRAIVAGIERDAGTKRAAIKIEPKASHSPSVQADAVRPPDPPPRAFAVVPADVLAAARAAAGITGPKVPS